MKHIINIDTWDRKSNFLHFMTYSNPYFGITCNVDCTKARKYAKAQGISFFLYYFYQSLSAANAIPVFRTRLEDKNPVIYDMVHGSPTVLRNDGGLGFAMLEYVDTLPEFLKKAVPELAQVKAQTYLDASQDCPDTIYYSILPWIRFTSVSHPLDLPNTEGVPIFTFGKTFNEEDRLMMPVGIHAHHALVDGMHIAEFVAAFQERLNRKS